jgi:ubiquinol-cytochrome c reductase iron-sulfur subunit
VITQASSLTRRDFVVLTSGALCAVGAACAVVPALLSMNPSQDVLALSSTEVNLAPIAEGQAITVMWRGKPVFIRHRTPADIAAARATPLKDLPDPQPDEARVKADKPQWLVTVGICTHLGCVPLLGKGEYGGWLCPCHGSVYDTSGRIRQGPAPSNLVVPDYAFLSETVIRIG